MPTTQAIHQYGTYLEYSTGDENGPFVEVAEVIKIMPPKRKGSRADATHLRSPNFTKEDIQSWATHGDAGFTCHYSVTSYVILNAFIGVNGAQGPLKHWRLNLPPVVNNVGDAYIEFDAQVIGLSLVDFSIGDNVIDMELELAVRGDQELVQVA